MRIYLERDVELDRGRRGGVAVYKAGGYYEVDPALGKDWIAREIALPATDDNTHEPRPTKSEPKPDKRPKGVRPEPKREPLKMKRPKGPSEEKPAPVIKPRKKKKAEVD